MSQMHPPGESQQTSQTGGSAPPQGGDRAGGTPAPGGAARTGEAAPATGRLFPTRNYLSEETRAESVAALNQVLADMTVLQSQLRSAHWNVKGRNFYQLHLLFEDLVELFEPFIDDVAERATALGGTARGTVRAAARASRLPEFPPELTHEGELLERVADSLAILDDELFQGMRAAEEQHDLDTVDLLNEVSREVSKALWFVEAHLQGTGARPGATPGSAGGRRAEPSRQPTQTR